MGREPFQTYRHISYRCEGNRQTIVPNRMNEPVGDEVPHHHDVLALQQQTSSNRRTKKLLVVQHGMAIEPHQLPNMNNTNDDQQQEEADNSSSTSHLSELFITMCFFARLGFIQPPCCLHCAYHAAKTAADDDKNKSSNNNNNNDTTTAVSNISECYNLIPWRIDTSILLHPSQLTTPLTTTTTISNKENNEEENNSDSYNSDSYNSGSGSSNIVFITCTTAQCLVNGDSYPSLRWDSRNKQLLLF